MDYAKRTALVDALIADARNKKCPPGFTITSYAVSALEILPAMGFRWLLIDLEHTELQVAKGGLIEVLRSAEATGLPYFVKLPTQWNITMATELLDFGVYGLQIPFTDSPEQIREILHAIRFYPTGNRSWCPPAMRALDYGTFFINGKLSMAREFFTFSHNKVQIIPTIESRESLKRIDELLAIEECLIWHMGPSDMMMRTFGWDGMSFTQDQIAEVVGVMAEAAVKIRAAGKLLMLPVEISDTGVSSAGHVGRCKPELPYGIDSSCFSWGVREAALICDRLRAQVADQPGQDPSHVHQPKSSG
jgi:2-keto-3-deoxy-L-rhamnonate aldolase RhmA